MKCGLQCLEEWKRDAQLNIEYGENRQSIEWSKRIIKLTDLVFELQDRLSFMSREIYPAEQSSKIYCEDAMNLILDLK